MRLIGAGSIGLQNKSETVGPPFPPSSANNGLSVDAITGAIVLGNDLGGTGAELLSDREIEMDNFLFRMMNGGPAANVFLLEPANGLFAMGDIGPANNGSQIVIDDIAQNVILATGINGIPGQPFVAGNGNSRIFQFGDTNSAANGLQLQIDDIGNTVRIENLVELMLFFGPSVFSMGNVNDTLNGSKISIDDLNEIFVFQSLARDRMLSLQGFNQLYRMGDIDATTSGLILSLDLANDFASIRDTLGAMIVTDRPNSVVSIGDYDAANFGTTLTVSDVAAGGAHLQNNALDAVFSCNGQTGITGVFLAPASITVEGGIVTAIV